MATTPNLPGLPFHPGAGLNQPPSGGATIGEQLTAKAQPLPVIAQPAQPPPRPNVQSIVDDPKFQALSGGAQIEVLSHVDPNFAALSGEAQQEVLTHLKPAAPPKKYLPGREFGMDVARGMGLDADRIKSAEDKGGQGEALKEIGSQVLEGLKGVLKDPLSPLSSASSNFEEAVKSGSPGKIIGALSTILGGAEAAEKGTSVAGKMVKALPSAEHAAQALREVKGAAGDIPIDMAKPGNTALELYTQAQRGATMPKVVRDFVTRATKPGAEPITYAEAKDFQSNVSALSAEERMQTKAPTLRLIGQLNSDLKGSLQNAAAVAGKGEKFADAMKEYHNAMRLRGFSEQAIKAAIGAGLTAAGIAGVKKIWDWAQ